MPVTVVSQGSGGSSGNIAAGNTHTFTANFVASNPSLYIVGVLAGVAVGTVTVSISDSRGTSWTPLTSTSGSAVKLALYWYYHNSSSALNGTVTFSFVTTLVGGLPQAVRTHNVLAQYSGVYAARPIRQTWFGSGSGTSFSFSSSTSVLSTDNANASFIAEKTTTADATSMDLTARSGWSGGRLGTDSGTGSGVRISGWVQSKANNPETTSSCSNASSAVSRDFSGVAIEINSAVVGPLEDIILGLDPAYPNHNFGLSGIPSAEAFGNICFQLPVIPCECPDTNEVTLPTLDDGSASSVVPETGRDILIDPITDNLALTASGDLAIVRGVDSIAQALRQRLRTYLGEWYLNVDAGVPWSTQILGVKNLNLSTVRSLLREQIKDIAGVLEITQLDVSLDKQARALSVVVRCTSDLGEFVENLTLGATENV